MRMRIAMVIGLMVWGGVAAGQTAIKEVFGRKIIGAVARSGSSTLSLGGIPAAEFRISNAASIFAFGYEGEDYLYVDFYVTNVLSDEPYTFKAESVWIKNDVLTALRVVPNRQIAATLLASVNATPLPPPRPIQPQSTTSQTTTTGRVDQFGNVSMRSRTTTTPTVTSGDIGAQAGANIGYGLAQLLSRPSNQHARDLAAHLTEQPFETAKVPPRSNMGFTAVVPREKNGYYEVYYEGIGHFVLRRR